MIRLYSDEALIDLKDSPYIEEMRELIGKEVSEDFHYSPTKLDEVVGDLSQIEARMLRIIARLVENDDNYSGVIQITDKVTNKYCCDTKFSKSMVFIALSKLSKNVMEGKKPLIIKMAPRERIYWVNPAVMCKKKLIDRFVEEVPEDFVPTVTKVEQNESEEPEQTLEQVG